MATRNITEIAIADIRIPEGRRALDPVKVAEIAASITLLGMLSPIGVRRHGDAPVELVWGGDRLAACLRLAVDAWRAPKRIFDAHPPDQYAQLRVDPRSPTQWTRLPTPVAAKAGPVPTHECLGPDDCENLQD